jgi:hypothetical protein
MPSTLVDQRVCGIGEALRWLRRRRTDAEIDEMCHPNASRSDMFTDIAQAMEDELLGGDDERS